MKVFKLFLLKKPSFLKMKLNIVIIKADNNDGGLADDEARRERKKKRRSRWMGSENEKAVIPGMPTILPSDIPPEQAEAYVCKLSNVNFLEINSLQD